MSERLKSHDLGRTSLSQFQWSQPQTLVGSNDLTTPEVSGPCSIDKTSPYPGPHPTAFLARHNRGEPGVRPRGTPATSHGEQCGQQLQTNDPSYAAR